MKEEKQQLPSSDRIRIGAELSARRKQLGMTQKDVADATGLDQSRIARVEHGTYSAGIDLLSRIAAALSCKITITTQ